MTKNMSIMLSVCLSFVSCTVLASVFYAPISKGDIKKIKELLSKGAKIDEADVAFAVLKGQVEVVALFLGKGAPLDESAMSSAVRGACENKTMSKAYEEIVHMLLKAHAPFDKNTLGMAVKCGNMKIVSMLVEAMPSFSNGKSSPGFGPIDGSKRFN